MRTETIASSNDKRTVLYVVVSTLHIEVEWFTLSSGLLGTVEYSYALYSSRNRSQQMLHRERTIEMNANHTDLLAVSVQVVDSLAGCFGSTTHQDDHAVCILSSIV